MRNIKISEGEEFMYSVNSKYQILKKYFLRLSSVFIIIVISVALTTCDSSSSSGPTYGNNNGSNTNSDGSSNSNEVTMVGQSFSPSNIEVSVGTTVTWLNDSDLVHTVTSGTPDNPDNMFDSGEIAPGEEFSYTFNQAGTYNYFCIPHAPSMTGVVTVTESNDDDGY